jgi:Polyketide cyclase / dehydrase and lipid transport
MFKKILIAFAVVIVVFLIVVATRPSEYHVARSVAIAAPPEVVFAQVNELKKWEAWNPWGKIDPAMKLTYEGPASGVGAAYAWVGNSEVGEGRMTLTESRPNEAVQFRLEFYKPMAGVSTAEFTFKPEGNMTTVTWSMTGKNNFIAKAFCLFVSMEKMIGGQFEKGLADLKSVSETAAKN